MYIRTGSEAFYQYSMNVTRRTYLLETAPTGQPPASRSSQQAWQMSNLQVIATH